MIRFSLLCVLLLSSTLSTLSAQTILPGCADAKGHAAPCPPPPATLQITEAPSPFNAPVRFGGEITFPSAGGPYWLWLKAGEPPTPCAPPNYTPACTAKIGQPLYITPPFRLAPPKPN